MMTKDLNKYVKPTLDWLLDKRFVSGNIPSSMGSPTDRLVQWCHGAPGFVPLCIKAYQVSCYVIYISKVVINIYPVLQKAPVLL